MASDSNLIKGARDVAMGAAESVKAGGAASNMIFSNTMQQMQTGIAETKAETIEQKKRNNALKDKFNADMEANAASSLNLSEKHYEKTKNAVEGLKMDMNACGFNDEACKREIMAKMNALTQKQTMQKDNRTANQEAFDNGLLSASLSSDEKYAMGLFMNNDEANYEFDFDKDPLEGGEGTYKMVMPNGEERVWKESELNKLFDKQIDVKGKETTSNMGVESHNVGLNGGEYDEVGTTAKYAKMIDGSLESFTHDDMGFGSFIDNIKVEGGPLDAALAKVGGQKAFGTSIGIEKKEGEENWYDTIDDDDRAMLADALVNPNSELYDEDVHKGAVNDYYKTMNKKQYDKGAKAKADSDAAALADAERKEAIRQQTRKDKFDMLNMRLNDLDEKEIDEKNLGLTINLATSKLTGPPSDDTYKALDGRKLSSGKPGYIRMENGNAYIFEGYPGTDDYKLVSPLDMSDPNKRQEQIFSQFGIPFQHMDRNLGTSSNKEAGANDGDGTDDAFVNDFFINEEKNIVPPTTVNDNTNSPAIEPEIIKP